MHNKYTYVNLTIFTEYLIKFRKYHYDLHVNKSRGLLKYNTIRLVYTICRLKVYLA